MILMIYTSFSSFVKVDYDILTTRHKVKRFRYLSTKSVIVHLLSQLKMLFWLAINLPRSKAVYIWFADYHSFLPVFISNLFGKKSFIVLGGYDVTYISELDYGAFNNKIRGAMTLWSIKKTTCNFAVSKFVAKQAANLANNLNVKVVYNAVDIKKFETINEPKENIILTVGIINSEQRIKLKGIDFFVQIAREMPNYKFILIGINDETKNKLGEIPPNLELIEYLQQNELAYYYQKAKVYCQFSLVESFCLALAEAMACGCTGIVSNTGALPEVIGKSGIILKDRSLSNATKSIEYAIKLNNSGNAEAVNRVTQKFNLEKRNNTIYEIFNKYGVFE